MLISGTPCSQEKFILYWVRSFTYALCRPVMYCLRHLLLLLNYVQCVIFNISRQKVCYFHCHIRTKSIYRLTVPSLRSGISGSQRPSSHSVHPLTSTCERLTALSMQYHWGKEIWEYNKTSVCFLVSTEFYASHTALVCVTFLPLASVLCNAHLLLTTKIQTSVMIQKYS